MLKIVCNDDSDMRGDTLYFIRIGGKWLYNGRDRMSGFWNHSISNIVRIPCGFSFKDIVQTWKPSKCTVFMKEWTSNEFKVRTPF